MKKNTNSRTATTFTVCLGWSPENREGITGTKIWKSAEDAREALALVESGDLEHTVHFAPGLEVHAFYAYGDIVTIMAFEDDTAARLHRAVRSARPVTVTYTKADGEETVRTIEPTALALTKAGDVIVKAADRLSGERRTFRLDRVSAYTVHRTRFTVRLEAPAPGKAELAAAFKLLRTEGPLVHSWHKGYFGYRVAGTRAFGPTGWSVVLQLTEDQAHLSPTGTVRVTESDLSPV